MASVPSMMFSNQASKMRVTVGQVGDVTTYMAESCHSSSSSAISSTPEIREFRKTALQLRIHGTSARPAMTCVTMLR